MYVHSFISNPSLVGNLTFEQEETLYIWVVLVILRFDPRTPNRSYCNLLNRQGGKLFAVSVHVRRAKYL